MSGGDRGSIFTSKKHSILGKIFPSQDQIFPSQDQIFPSQDLVPATIRKHGKYKPQWKLFNSSLFSSEVRQPFF